MTLIFKAFGAIFIMCACWGFGLVRSFELKEKKQNLLKFLMRLERLQTGIRLLKEETFPLLKTIFSDCGILDFSGGVRANEKAFLKKDGEIINEFLSGLGGTDKNGECARIEAYKHILNKRYEALCEEYKNKTKVWQTVSLSLGAVVALIII